LKSDINEEKKKIKNEKNGAVCRREKFNQKILHQECEKKKKIINPEKLCENQK
jgi:hypothetical protein